MIDKHNIQIRDPFVLPIPAEGRYLLDARTTGDSSLAQQIND